MSFKHLNIYEREKIYLWNETGVKKKEIARRLKRTPKCIREELKRNTKYGRKYSPTTAQKRAERVSTAQRYQAPLKGPEVYLYVREHLRYPYFWSPEIISGRIGLDIKSASIDPETIYRYIHSRKARRYKLWVHLPLQRKKRMKKKGRKVKHTGKVPGAVSIDNRSPIVSRRKQVGHWETDNVEGPKTSKSALSVTVERVTRYHLITKIPNQTAQIKSRAVVARLKVFEPKLRKTLTQDNGKENYAHKKTAKQLDMKMYFCHAYHSWEKGTVENRNKSIRRYLPKGTDFATISDEQVKVVEDMLNNTPMKCLGFKTPYEKMCELKVFS